MYTKKALLILILSTSINSFSQLKIDSSFTPNLDSMIFSLKAFYTYKTDTETLLIKQKLRFKWLNYLPSIGYNFGFNTPSIGYNTNQLSQSLNAKQTKKTLIEQIKQQNDIEYKNACIEVIFLIRNLQNNIALYHSDLEIFQYQIELFNLRKKEYDKGDITPEAYLNHKIQFENIKQNLLKQYNEIETLKNSILYKSKKAEVISLFNDSNNLSHLNAN